MKLRVLFLLLIPALLIGGVDAQSPAADSSRRIIGYFPSWGVYARAYMANDIPAHQITHLNYAFANFNPQHGCVLGDPSADTTIRYVELPPDAPYAGNFGYINLVLKAQNPQLQTLLSIGGWNWSALFSDVAAEVETRERFAETCAGLMLQYGFDGLDIDWEYPTGGGHMLNRERPEDPENFILLLEALRRKLDELGAQNDRHFLLTIAASAGRDKYEPLDWSRIEPLLDFINVMTYDMAGIYSEQTGFNAPLYDSTDPPPEGTSTDTAIQDYLALGIPADKLVIGVPFYGRGWGGVGPENDGLHQPFTEIPVGTWEVGNFEYQDLAENYVPHYQRFWDERAQVPWLYSAETGIMITYDDPESMRVKANYVLDNGLGGVMFWELSGDDAQGSLLTALYDTLYPNG
ncbi:MAG: glycoside hydrolase family 18 protein [Anaerolineae bacterium]|nr:glycoside hydrolase family 18 protein [Anaerolineae bacterium]